LTQLNNLHSNYPAGANDGKISSIYNATSGWGENHGFDSFGNLVSKVPTPGSPPALSQAVDPATNRLGPPTPMAIHRVH
jgi:hypothetical protein